MAGTLFIVATPIGNLQDITLRAIEVLRKVDLIACEDTRHTRKLLTHYGISNRLVSYHEHNERERTPELIAKLESGLNIALVSDAGTPLVSDPGYRLVQEVTARSIRVTPVPGPSAVIAALSASGLPSDTFTFIGFLPPTRKARRDRLVQLSKLSSTLIFYEAPHRLRPMLADTAEILGDRECVIARELTKLHEEFIRGKLSEIALSSPVRGEIVLMVAPQARESAAFDESKSAEPISQAVARAISEGLDYKEALKRAAKERAISKSAAYKQLLRERNEGESNQ